jgi:hypothetical protein
MSARAPLQKLNAVMVALMLRELQAGPCSSRDLAEVTGMRRPTVRGYLQTMHRYGCLHISGWECDSVGRERSAVYSLGHGKDKARRPPQPNTESCAKYQRRLPLLRLERAALRIAA